MQFDQSKLIFAGRGIFFYVRLSADPTALIYKPLMKNQGNVSVTIRGVMLFSFSTGRTVFVHDVHTFSHLYSLSEAPCHVSSLCFDENKLVAVGWSKNGFLWDFQCKDV